MAFNVPINSIAPIPTPSNWVRASDWPVITDAPNEVQFLVADTGAKAFTIRTTFTRTSGNIYIDWGDGVTDTISTTTSTDTSHIYSTGGTPCSRGYNTFKIRIYGDPTCVITNAQHITNTSVSGGIYYNIGLLEAYFGNNTCNTTAFNANYFNCFNSTNSSGSFQLLEYVKLPATVTWNAQMPSMFQNCSNLFVIVMPTSASSLASLIQMASGCTNLRDITLPSNATSITNLTSAFSGCTNLRTITFPTNLNNCTTLNSAFNNCTSLKNVTLPSINLCTSLTSIFSGCTSLQWVRFTSLPSPASPSTAIPCTTAFLNCYNLQNVYLPSSCSGNAIYGMGQVFQACYNLRNIVFPTNFNASTLATTFSASYSLTTVTFQSPMPALTTINSAFTNCVLLNSVTLPTTVGATIDMGGTFNNCQSLSNITIPSGWTISNLASTFSNCFNLTSITLPNNAQNSIASMGSMCQSCIKLETIVMPTSLNLVNNIGSIFASCNNLTSVVFPTTMNAVTTASSAFSGCWELRSVTMPTSMSNCSNFQNTFSSCYSITSITMPATVAASMTTGYQSLVLGCASLNTLTLPTTQTSTLTNITNMTFACGSLVTINNLSFVGATGSAPLVDGSIASGSGTFMNRMTSLSFTCPFSRLTLFGTNTTTNFNRLNSLRLLNAGAGQYTGSSPQIAVGYCNLGAAALNQLFTDLPTITSKTIDITSCTGATTCNRSIATAKGWTVTG
jgi:hypothetical protein